ncbi:MAG: TatD family hydrolase [Bacteroidota bacterium]
MIPRPDQFVNLHAHRLALHEKEWVLTSVFAQDYPPENMDRGVFSTGLHPWHLGKTDQEIALHKVRLATESFNVLAVGETGLDKAISYPLDQQLKIFTRQVEIAEYADLPVIVHNVRAHQELITFMKVNRPVVPMIIHGFRGGAELAEDLLHAGFFLSFGVHFLNDAKTAEALGTAPMERLFLETDEASDDIRILYRKAAELKGISQDLLQIQVQENARLVFGSPGRET